jgi:hypothetical protein
VNIAKQIIRDEKPDYLIHLGDGGDFESLNGFNRHKLLLKEGKRVHKDINTMIALDTEIADCTKPRYCEKIRLIGNHENWVNLFVQRNPELEGLHEFDIKGRYEELGWTVIPWGQFYRIGKLSFHHGDRVGYQGIYHARKWAGSGHSVVYGHRHDAQRFTGEVLEASGDMIPCAGFGVGCLGLRTPNWMHNRRNNWSNGIAVVYFRPNGLFNVYQIDFIKGKCIWNGKEYVG